MVEIIAILGVFAVGVIVGVIILVSVGIRREERRYLRQRRSREENGIGGSPDQPLHYLTEQPPDAVSSVSRSLNGLYVRHLPADLPLPADLSQGG
jgi:hypothetical protein